jgi:hypothetical protein
MTTFGLPFFSWYAGLPGSSIRTSSLKTDCREEWKEGQGKGSDHGNRKDFWAQRTIDSREKICELPHSTDRLFLSKLGFESKLWPYAAINVREADTKTTCAN